MGSYHWERNVSSLAIICYSNLLSKLSSESVTTDVFRHIFAIFTHVRTATEVFAVHSNLSALAALGGTPFLDTPVLHKMDDGLRCGVSVVMSGIHALSSSFHSHPKSFSDGKAGLKFLSLFHTGN